MGDESRKTPSLSSSLPSCGSVAWREEARERKRENVKGNCGAGEGEGKRRNAAERRAWESNSWNRKSKQVRKILVN